MEQYLFYAYLEYLKEKNLSPGFKFLKLPLHIILLLAGTLISFVVTIAGIFINNPWVTWLPLIFEVACCIALYYCVENYQIKFSITDYFEYQKHCKNLAIWLEQFSLKTNEDISMLRDRLNARIATLKAEEENRTTRSDKWLQTLVIPVVLSVITNIITNQKDATTMITVTSAILLVFVIVYSCIAVIKNIVHFPQREKTRQMERFANDLQGLLDFKTLS